MARNLRDNPLLALIHLVLRRQTARDVPFDDYAVARLGCEDAEVQRSVGRGAVGGSEGDELLAAGDEGVQVRLEAGEEELQFDVSVRDR